jgi:hypothetical protein
VATRVNAAFACRSTLLFTPGAALRGVPTQTPAIRTERTFFSLEAPLGRLALLVQPAGLGHHHLLVRLIFRRNLQAQPSVEGVALKKAALVPLNYSDNTAAKP